jgi:hypothetical protein
VIERDDEYASSMASIGREREKSSPFEGREAQ